MKRPRRETVVAWGRRLLAAGAFVFLGYLFAHNLRPWPRYEVRTGAKRKQLALLHWSLPLWTAVEHVSDDGRLVTVGLYESSSSVEVWDVAAGVNRTPAHWQDLVWREFLSRVRFHEGDGWARLLSHPAGREFLHDPAAWTSLRERLAGRPGEVCRGTDPEARLPTYFEISADGRFVSYAMHDGRPLYGMLRESGAKTVIENARTGRRVAVLPDDIGVITLAPDGRTAICQKGLPDKSGRDVLYLPFDENESEPPADRPFLSVWDLEAPACRAELFLPHRPYHVEYSPDGRYVFARLYRPDLLRWWDADTGKPVADIYTSSSPKFLDGGNLLVTDSPDHETLHFWDVATGRELDKWDIDPPPDGRIIKVTCSADRFVLAEVDPSSEPPAKSFPAMERVVEWLTNRLSERRSDRDRRQILVLDAIDRRPLGQVPGVAGSVSANGHWLATLDADGVVRVWELPVGRPWARGFAYAAGVFVVGWGVGRLRLRRRAGGDA